MVQHSQFGGSPLEDPDDHIRTFLEYYNTNEQDGVPAYSIKLSLFPFSLRDDAKVWLHSLQRTLTDTSGFEVITWYLFWVPILAQLMLSSSLGEVRVCTPGV